MALDMKNYRAVLQAGETLQEACLPHAVRAGWAEKPPTSKALAALVIGAFAAAEVLGVRLAEVLVETLDAGG